LGSACGPRRAASIARCISAVLSSMSCPRAWKPGVRSGSGRMVVQGWHPRATDHDDRRRDPRASPARAAYHPDFHRRSRSSTGSTGRWLRSGRGLSPPVRNYTDPGARVTPSMPHPGAGLPWPRRVCSLTRMPLGTRAPQAATTRRIRPWRPTRPPG
jgi:hypothetical protein